jgi:hypothetical protein
MKTRTLLIYDGLGAATTIAVLALGVWLGLMRPSADSTRLLTLRAELAEAKTSLRAASDELLLHTDRLAELKRNLEQRGALPTKSPVEADLRVITFLARDNAVELGEVTPVGGKTYPGINELRYAVKTKSTFDGLVRFLADFQKATLWADITQLKVGVPPSLDGGSDATRSAEFTVSLLSSCESPDQEATQ